MATENLSDWELFCLLCRVLGGRDEAVLRDSVEAGLLPSLLLEAHRHDVIPALAVRCNEALGNHPVLDSAAGKELQHALRANVMRNMQISAQALKLTRRLNDIGVTPLFLKGTAQLLATNTDNLGFRKQLDIDVLVESVALRGSVAALLSDGYQFYDFSDNRSPALIGDTASAIKASKGHHHLPELIKPGDGAIVELHRHFLPVQQQSRINRNAIFDSAIPCASHGVEFRIPSPECRLIHLVLGNFIHDGHLARRSLSLRDACDMLHILDVTESSIDHDLVSRVCDKRDQVLFSLVDALMGSQTATAGALNSNTHLQLRLRTMKSRTESGALATLLDAYARMLYLAGSLAHSPSKLKAYVARRR